MQAKTFVKIAVLLIVAFALFACSDKKGTKDLSQTAKPVVFVVNYPLEYFAKRIGGDSFDVRFPDPGDEDPAYWRPDTETINEYQKADLILLNGADYAKWAKNVSLPPSKIVDTSASFKDNYIEIPNAVTHSHGPESKHAHGTVAFTTWLDFTLAVEQAKAIKTAFIKLKPENENDFESNFKSLEQDLLDLDQQMQNIAAQVKTKPLIASHPVYQYVARRYKLNMKSLHWEPDEYPSEQSWKELETLNQQLSANYMIWEDKPLPKISDQLKNSELDSIVFNPCSNRPADGDFMQIMKKNIENLRSITELTLNN